MLLGTFGGLVNTVLLALQDPVDPLPGPGPWGLRAWVGAGAYVLVFLASVYGVWRLVRDIPEDGTASESGTTGETTS